MESRSLRFLLRVPATLVLAAVMVMAVVAQDDPDPNSPAPVLLTENSSTRALASFEGRQAQVFQPDSRIALYVTGFKLPEDEGAGAFRVYVEDADGRKYRFPVTDIRGSGRGIYELTVQLTDQIGFARRPKADGDVLVAVTWRGMISNRVRLGLGQTGGRIKDDPPVVATPMAKDPVVRSKTGEATPEYVGYRWSGDRSRFMQQAAFGWDANLDNRIRRIGIRSWLAEQFTAQYPSLNNPYPDFPQKNIDAANATTGCGMFPNPSAEYTACIRDHYRMYQPQNWFFREALNGDAQLRHRTAWALAQIWVTAFPEVQQTRHMIEFQKILGNNAFGNYRNLMKEMTLNPAMGNYLDMAISTRTNPNENYARELMQLFSVGLFLLNQDGTLKLDQSGNPIPTYTQDGVNNLTKLLTGFTLCSVQAQCPNIVAGVPNYVDPMRIINTNNHDLTAKTLLSWPADPAFPANNTNVAACTNCTNAANITTYANASLEQAIDNAFNHPNVGPFVGKILIQHMVTSDPSPAYVSRVAAAFNNNGVSVRGDMKAVIRAILLDPEARGDVKTDPGFGKLREPVQYATNFLRPLGVRSADGLQQTDGYLTGRAEFNSMAQIPYQSPTVFNFYPPDYTVPLSGVAGPEFAIMTTGTAIARTNFINRFTFSAPAIPVSVDSPRGLSVTFTDLQALAAGDATGNALLDELNRRFLHNTMTSANRSTILTAVTSIPNTDTLLRVRQAVYLVTTSSQFQVQR